MHGDKPVVIVTGSNGLIGSAIAARFQHDYTVVGFDLGTRKPTSPVAAFFTVDLTSDDSVHQALAMVRERYGSAVASVIHLAAFYDFSGEASPMYDEVTVRGTVRLLQALRAFTVDQFVFSSTLLVHAPCEPGQRITEESPLDPKWPYPQSKVATEQLLHSEHGAMPLVVLRIAGVYTNRCQSVPLSRQIQRIYERQFTSYVFPGDTSRGQPFVHLDDLVEACWSTVQRRAGLPAETTILIGEDETLSYDELQHRLGRLIHGENWDTLHVPKPIAKTGAWLQEHVPLMEEPFIKPWMIDLADDHYELDITRARTLLGWNPSRSLRGTLPLMVLALKRDPRRWYQENKLEVPANLDEIAAQVPADTRDAA